MGRTKEIRKQFTKSNTALRWHSINQAGMTDTLAGHRSLYEIPKKEARSQRRKDAVEEHARMKLQRLKNYVDAVASGEHDEVIPEVFRASLRYLVAHGVKVDFPRR